MNKEIERIGGMKDGELVARLQQYSQMIGSAQFMNKQEQIDELSGLDMAIADELLKRLSFTDGQITSLERDLLDDLIRPNLGVVGKSRMIEGASSQDFNFRVLLENIKSLYKGKIIFGTDHRDWNKLIEELLD